MKSPAVAAERWNSLLLWLQQHGMDVTSFRVKRRPLPGAGFGLFATDFVPASGLLFSIPATALVNQTTLESHYPASKSLSATQLISLHLFLSCPQANRESDDTLFGPFISILPREFDSHPLSWIVERSIVEEFSPTISELLDVLPPLVTSALNSLQDRFRKDWDAVSKYLRDQLLLQKLESILDYLWAWLNVNTRCIYRRLKQTRSDPANVTLCPILDFANHSWKASNIVPASNSDEHNSHYASKRSDGFSFLTSQNVDADEEICLLYGAHPNTTLFVEYGFVNDFPRESIRNGEYPGEVNAQTVIEGMFESKGLVGVWMKQVLEDEGYWGDWTLHSSPSPASPSFRVTSALRLYAMFAHCLEVPDFAEDALLDWRHTLVGIADQISAENEREWKKNLQQVCERLIGEGNSGRAKTSRIVLKEGDEQWVGWMKNHIKVMWEEQIEVAYAVLESIQNGVEF